MWFSLFMIVLLLITGGIWLVDKLFWEKGRQPLPEKKVNTASKADIVEDNKPTTNEPVLVEYAKSFFPVILIVFVIRSFIVEPFKIPSGSMIPTLLVGDYILVNKYDYGLRVPILNQTFIEVGHPERGDVVVFHFPPTPSIDYIKRVIGLPGDQIQYKDKQLTVNGKIFSQESLGQYHYRDSGDKAVDERHIEETIGDRKHDILVTDYPLNYYNRSETIGYQLQQGATITIPEGHYFMMGDNRDHSSDSRYWGLVPEGNLVGRAFFIWMNFGYLGKLFSDESRIGTSIE